jgi:hypothetical protein
MTHSPFTTVLAAALLTQGVAVSQAAATGHTQVVAVTGDAAPDGNGSLGGFGVPVLNDGGQAAFYGALAGTNGGSSDNSGIFRAGGGPLIQIAREGQAAPGAAGAFSSFDLLPGLNDGGQAVFYADLRGTSGGLSDNSGIFFFDDALGLLQVAREGQAAPDANGVFPSLIFVNVALNDAGQAAFRQFLNGTSGGSSDDNGLFLFTATLGLVQVAREGQAAPDGNGSFVGFNDPILNNVGEAAFIAPLTGTSGGTSDDSGIFRAGGGVLTQLTRKGQTAPGGNGNFSSFFAFVFNGGGQTAFTASLTGTSGGLSDNVGIFLLDDALGLMQVARKGQAAPDASGVFSSFGGLAINDGGQTAFHGFLTGTSGGTSDDSGIFLFDDALGLRQLVREGQAAPDGNGALFSLGSPTLNNRGQMAFISPLIGTSGGTSDDSGIFFFDDASGLLQVARKGGDLLGSTITSLSFNSNGDERSGFNELGQVAYHFELADGRRGVAIWTIPEPTSAALLGLGGAALLCQVRRRG